MAVPCDTPADTPSSFSIQVSNLLDGETLTYPLALVKGSVICQDRTPASGQLSLTASGLQGGWPVTEGQFKALVSLREGRNELALVFGGSTRTMHLVYEPRETEHVVVPVYIVPSDHDGRFQGPEGADCSVESALARISFCARLLQAVVAEKLWEMGLGRRSFVLQGECVLHRGALPTEAVLRLSGEQLWEHYGRELVRTWGVERAARLKFLAFLACTEYSGGPESAGLSYEEVLARTRGHVALGGGGLALFGSACLHTWPASERELLRCVRDTTPVDQANLMDDSCYRGTYGGCFSTTLGSVLHELCHAFDLGHTSKGVMGRGFDRMDLVLGAADSSWDPRHAQVDFTQTLRVHCVVQSGPQPAASTGPRPRHHALRPPGCSDLTFFTESCAFLLAFHRWFNSEVEPSGCRLQFDTASWTLRSGAGVRVVEVRSGPRQEVRASWCLKPARHVFVVPRSALPPRLTPPLLLVAQDSAGSILSIPLDQ